MSPFTTMSLSITVLSSGLAEALRAEARVVNRGENVGYVECEVTDGDGKKVAKATSMCYVLRGTPAQGR